MSETQITETNYLNCERTVKSWFLTLDHKRIAILYLCTVLVFFIVGALGAAIFRIELMTPKASFLTHETYNKMFTMHGVTMIFFFLVPVVPAPAGPT